MAKIHDEEREERIIYEVIVDCYDEHEAMMGWFYYMHDGLSFPIDAVVNLPLRGGKTEQKKVQIVEIDPASEDENPIRVGIVEADSQRIVHISPENLVSIDTNEDNRQIINDWLYWHDFDLL
jgi:hypothetical protein